MSSPRSGNTVHPFAWSAVIEGGPGVEVEVEVESIMPFLAAKADEQEGGDR